MPKNKFYPKLAEFSLACSYCDLAAVRTPTTTCVENDDGLPLHSGESILDLLARLAVASYGSMAPQLGRLLELTKFFHG